MEPSMNSRNNNNGPLQPHEKVIIAVFSVCMLVGLFFWLNLL